MPTKRKRKTHARRPEISETALFYATDGFWSTKAEADGFDKLIYRYPTVCPEECRAVWLAIRDEVLVDWIKAYPGPRPSWWYLFDSECPRVSSEDIQRHEWEGCYFLEHIPDLRRRLGGIGDPDFEHWSIVPSFRCAVPTRFVIESDLSEEDENFHGKAIDPKNPPRYESQATYLKRNDLLSAAEKRLLKRKDFEPEIVDFV